MSPYPWWPGNSTFNKVLSFPIGGVNNPVIRAEFNYQLGGSGVIEFRLRDFSTNTVTGVYTAGTGGTFTLRCDWLYPMGDGFVRGGTWRRVEVQARVASGTPTLSVWPWITVGTQLSVATNASASGFWTLNP
jgi:hypothetical protein